jgi:hypothetical protein
MNKEEMLKKLKIEANDIKDRIEDLTNCYKKGTVDEIIKEQESELKKINSVIEELEKQYD